MGNRSTFPLLRLLMIRYEMNVSDIAKIIGWSYPPTLNKISMRSEFTLVDMLLIKQYFESKGEKYTIDDLFYDWLLADENGKGKVVLLLKKH